MKLTTEIRQSETGCSDYPELKIDGIALESALSTMLQNPEILILVPAHSWLHNKSEQVLAWERIFACGEGQISYVPLLVCDSDMDLNCTVVVAQQESSGNVVLWSKFGYAQDRQINEIEWFENCPEMRFTRSDFLNAIFKYAELCDWAMEY